MKKITSIILALSMILSLFNSASVFAEAAEEGYASAETSVTVEDGERYVITRSVEAGGKYALAYEENGTYYVVTNVDGAPGVSVLDELTAKTVGESMLWELAGTNGAFSIGNGGEYLTADGSVALTSDGSYTWWDYNAENGYIDYTNWSDEIYLLSVSDGVLTAYDGDFDSAAGKVAFYAPESSAVEEVPTVKGTLRSGLKSSSGTTHYIAVASDRHSTSSAIGNAMHGMPTSVEYVCLNGDMVDNGSYNTSTLVTEVQNDAGLSSATVNVLYGSHDSSANDDAGILKCRSSSDLIYTGYEDDGSIAYYVYGAAYNSLTSANTTDPTAFEKWIDTITDTSIPIIVISHVPLHNQRNDNGGAVAWNKALNYAATGKETTSAGEEIIRDVIFLHGHNHTTESNTEYYIPVGSTMQIYNSSNSSYIYYTYTTAGYLRNNTAATLIGIDSENITISKYQNGSVKSTYASSGAKTDFSDTYDTDATHTIGRVAAEEVADGTLTGITVDTTNAKLTYTIGEDTEFDLSGLVVTASYKNAESKVVENYTTNAVEVVDLTKAGKYTVTVTYSEDNGTRELITKTATFDVTVKAAPSGSTDTVYVLTDTMEAGKNYLIVGSGTAGTSNALTHTSGTVGVDAVTINAGTEDTENKVFINASDVEESSIWAVTTSGNYTKIINNDKYYLQITTSSFTLSATEEETYNTNNWTFANNILTVKYTSGNNSRTRYVVYSNSTFEGDENSSATIYLYEEKTIQSGSEVEYDFTADDISVMADEDGSVANKIISYSLTVDGDEFDPDSISFAVAEDVDNIIDSVSEGGEIAFTGTVGTAKININYTYTNEDEDQVSETYQINVSVRAYAEHTWSTSPVWTWEAMRQVTLQRPLLSCAPTKTATKHMLQKQQ